MLRLARDRLVKRLSLGPEIPDQGLQRRTLLTQLRGQIAGIVRSGITDLLQAETLIADLR